MIVCSRKRDVNNKCGIKFKKEKRLSTDFEKNEDQTNLRDLTLFIQVFSRKLQKVTCLY